MPIPVIAKNFSEYFINESRKENFLKQKRKFFKSLSNESQAETENFILMDAIK
jgi:hypothetical protein